MTAVNSDQSLGLIVAPGAPSVAEDQALALIVEQRLIPAIISNYVDQLLALIVEKRNFALIQLVGGGYQDFLGHPLNQGYLMMRIDNPSETYTVGDEVVEGDDIRFKITLDANGNVVTSPPQYVFSTDVMTPACKYVLVPYKADGTTAGAPQYITVPNTSSSYDLSNYIPSNPTF